MSDKYLTSFLIGFSLMFSLHYFLEPTWGVSEQRPSSIRMIANYTIGVLGIACAFVYLHPELWFDLFVSISGAASATVLAHSRDWLTALVQRDRAHGLIEDSQKKS